MINEIKNQAKLCSQPVGKHAVERYWMMKNDEGRTTTKYAVCIDYEDWTGRDM